MKKLSEAKMQEIHERIMAAVMRSVAKGAAPAEACELHMLRLESEWPKVAATYKAWAVSKVA